jgi:hypothetical protein
VFTPHIVANLSNIDVAHDSQTVFEAGPGISVKYWYDDTRYQAYRSSAEAQLQYRVGVDDRGDISHGVVATLLVSF